MERDREGGPPPSQETLLTSAEPMKTAPHRRFSDAGRGSPPAHFGRLLPLQNDLPLPSPTPVITGVVTVTTISASTASGQHRPALRTTDHHLWGFQWLSLYSCSSAVHSQHCCSSHLPPANNFARRMLPGRLERPSPCPHRRKGPTPSAGVLSVGASKRTTIPDGRTRPSPAA
jgi:hypothetical protein